MKTYSTWNQKQFNEYLHKSSQYEMNNNFKNNSFSTINNTTSFNGYQSKNSFSINKQKDFDNFYSLPGLQMSDENPTDYTTINNNDDFFLNGTDTFNSFLNSQTQKDKLGPCENSSGFDYKVGNSCSRFPANTFPSHHHINLTKSDSTIDISQPLQNCQSFSPINSSFKNLQKAYTQAAWNLKSLMESSEPLKSNAFPSSLSPTHGTISIIDKSVQTQNNDENNSSETKKTDEKSNQTSKITTKNVGISTDIYLMNKWFENQMSNNKSSSKASTKESEILDEKKNRITMKSLTTDVDQSMNSPSPVMWPVKYDLSKNSHTKVSDSKSLNVNPKKRIREKSQSLRKFNYHNSDTENESAIGNDSNQEELTVISKTNSKFASFNDILENLEIHLQNSSISLKNNSQKRSNGQNKENRFYSFWDNPLDKFELTKTESHPTYGKDLHFEFSDMQTDNLNKSLKDNLMSSKQSREEMGDIQNALISEEDERSGLKVKNIISDKVKSKSFTKDNKSLSKSTGYSFNPNRKSLAFTPGMKYSKSFYLNPYDDLVKSHFNPIDRRIKAVSSKNGSTIQVEGPINAYDNYSMTPLSKSKVVYRCTIASSNQESLDKCINYLKETFPNTYLRNGVKSISK